MKLLLVFMTTLLIVLGISACSERDDSPKESSAIAGGMKCGAGKCGANMFDGNAAVAKKKANIIRQMQENDPRRDCVANAQTTKEVYNCVRDPETGKLSKNFSGESVEKSSMKCGAGKCGASMERTEPKEEPAMKCGAGKCGAM